MSIRKRMILQVILDSFIVLAAICIAFFILHPYVSGFTNTMLFISMITMQISHFFFAWYFGLYRKAWNYASVGELKSILKAVSFTTAFVMIVQLVLTQDIYFRLLGLAWMLHILLLGSSRLYWRVFRTPSSQQKRIIAKRTLIVGAGMAGRMVTRQILENTDSGMSPILFVDDDREKHGLEIYGVPVSRGTKQIPNLVKEKNIQKIVIAIPSLSRKEMAQLSKLCIETGVKTVTIPRIEDLMTGKVSVNDMQDVKIEDLLGRDEVKLDLQVLADKLTGKTILVTGAGGSIGSEICRQVSRFEPKRLILLGHGENSIYHISMELEKCTLPQTEIISIIADVKDRLRVSDIVSEYMPDVIYHTAAHKHVPLMEENPMEAVKNNIFGTKNIAEAADTFGVPYFVMVSTDKAVNPPNIMGATKRFAEMIVQNLAINSNTKFAAVRFGNVLGSRGSVVPLFIHQIKSGGPVTITDPKMTRYFMTIPEASRLVIQAGALASGGEVFVLDMGEPVKIVDLAKNLIHLSGYNVDEIGIKYLGIRPGEKLYEELLNENEIQSDTIFPKIYIGRATPINKDEMNLILDRILDMTDHEVKKMLIKIANNKVFKEKEEQGTTVQ